MFAVTRCPVQDPCRQSRGLFFYTFGFVRYEVPAVLAKNLSNVRRGPSVEQVTKPIVVRLECYMR